MTCHPHMASGVLLRAMPCIMVADAFSRRGVGLVCAIGDFPIFDRRHCPLAAQAPVALGVVSGTLVQSYTCFTASARPLPPFRILPILFSSVNKSVSFHFSSFTISSFACFLLLSRQFSKNALNYYIIIII